MFTGIIEEVGEVRSNVEGEIRIKAKKILWGTQKGWVGRGMPRLQSQLPANEGSRRIAPPGRARPDQMASLNS